MRANNGTFEVLLGADAAGGIVSTMTNHDLQLRAGGNDTKVVIKADGRLGVGIATPSNRFHVVGNLGIRQNRLYVSGGDGGLDNWSSISYNAHHNDANNAWTFPDATRKAVALEMDDSNGPARFQVLTTRSAAPTSWVQRLAINGETGDILMAPERRHGRHRWQHPEPPCGTSLRCSTTSRATRRSAGRSRAAAAWSSSSPPGPDSPRSSPRSGLTSTSTAPSGARSGGSPMRGTPTGHSWPTPSSSPAWPPGSHTLTLVARPGTSIDLNDFFNVTVIEFPWV